MRGWEGGTGVRTAMHQLPQPAAVWIRSATASEHALPSGPCGVKLRRVKRSPGAGGGEHARCCDRLQIQSLASEGLSQFQECKISFKSSKEYWFCGSSRCLSCFETSIWTDCESCRLFGTYAATVLEQAVK